MPTIVPLPNEKYSSMDQSTPLYLRRFCIIGCSIIHYYLESDDDRGSSYCNDKMPNHVDYNTLSSFLILYCPLSAEAE
jgi:hypothetical protein